MPEFTWEYVEEGPEVWRVHIGRIAPASATAAVEDHPGVPVACVPLWHAVVTARLVFAGDHDTLKSAQRRLSAALGEIERLHPLARLGSSSRSPTGCRISATVSRTSSGRCSVRGNRF